MKFYTRAYDRPLRRFVGWVVSMIILLVASAFFASAVAASDAPLRYVHGWAFLVSVALFALNAAVQLPLVFSDRGLGDAFEAASPRFVPLAAAVAALLGALPFSVGCVVLARRAENVLRTAITPEVIHNYRGMLFTAVLAALLFLAGAVGLLLHAFVPERFPAAGIILHLPLPIGCAVFSLYLYFDKTTPRNATLKLCVSLAFLLLALLLLLRIRMMVGSPRPRLAVWLARAALPYTVGVGVTLLCLSIAKHLVFVSYVIPAALLFLSFYIFVTIIRPTVGVTETGPLTPGAPDAQDDFGDPGAPTDAPDTPEHRDQDGENAGEE